MNCLEFCAGNISPLSFTLSFTKPPFSWFVQVISMGLGMGNCPHIMSRLGLLPATCMERSCHQQYPTKHIKLINLTTQVWIYIVYCFFLFFFNLIWCRSKNSKNGRKLSKIQRTWITSSYFPTQHPIFMMIRT